jgi:hypothetical protein
MLSWKSGANRCPWSNSLIAWKIEAISSSYGRSRMIGQVATVRARRKFLDPLYDPEMSRLKS